MKYNHLHQIRMELYETRTGTSWLITKLDFNFEYNVLIMLVDADPLPLSSVSLDFEHGLDLLF